MTFQRQWPARAFTIRCEGDAPCLIIAKGRDRWALEALMAAGPNGCTPINNPAPRWAAYIHNLRALGVAIDTITEKHGGPFAGHHARYVLRCHVTAGREGGAA
ncbi:hypothetical protein H5394_10340 [Paracoccus sp. MC1862]|nr:hypothetical protein [Paracoccus sp. MC1862]QQO43882.1 hypothetical protein JGR78_10650 [Paracoccus sp. MC1862]